MDALTKFIAPGLLFLLTLASGVWLSSAGKPLNALIFNLHKLIALGSVVLTILQLIPALKGGSLQALLVAMLALAALSVLALFASGAMMSIGKVNYSLMLVIHQVAPVLAGIALAVIIYLIVGKK